MTSKVLGSFVLFGKPPFSFSTCRCAWKQERGGETQGKGLPFPQLDMWGKKYGFFWKTWSSPQLRRWPLVEACYSQDHQNEGHREREDGRQGQRADFAAPMMLKPL